MTPLFGDPVSEETSMAVSTVYRCATLIASTIASLDIGIFTDNTDLGRVPVGGKLSRLLTVCPFPDRQMTAYSWKETLTLDLLLFGNCYSAIRWDGAARIAAFEYVSPRHVTISQNNQMNIYTVRWPDNRPEEMFPSKSMIHVAGPSLDGILGMSKVRQCAKNSIAMARSMEECAGRAFDLAMSPKSVVKLPPGMSPDAMKRLQAFMANEFSGKTNNGKTLFLDSGTEYSSLQISLVDLALLDARKASVVEICSWFGVPPTLLGVTGDGVTAYGAGISALLIAFLKFALNSELERFENEFRNKCTTGNQYIYFDRAQLLQMDPETSANIATKEVAAGISTINEIRRTLHKPTVEGGDVPLTNSTNVPLGQAIMPKAPPPTGQPA